MEAENECQSWKFSIDGSCFGFEEYLVEATDCYLLAIEVLSIFFFSIKSN